MEFYFVERVFLLKFVGKKKHASIYGFYSINFASRFYNKFKWVSLKKYNKPFLK